MRSKGLALLLLSVALIGCSRTAEEKFVVKRGVNISHWLSQSDRRGEARRAWFTEKDVQFLAGLGLDHLRIPIDEEQMWDEQGNQEAEAFALLNSGLDWCAKYKLRAVVDLHILRSHHFIAAEKPLWTQPEAQERFLQCWRELSDALKNRPVSMVAYELMNEPVADDPEDWNKLVARAVAVVREREPKRVIVIGSNRWQSVDTFDRLRVPENDPNILLSFHFYEPLAFTHYKASWAHIRDYTGPVRYPGVTVTQEDLAPFPPELQEIMKPYVRQFDRGTIIEMIQKPLALAKQTGLPLYCGEWGCLPTVPQADRLAWYRDVRSVLEENGIGWANWDYKGSFAIVDANGNPHNELIQVLYK
ncbi:MAG: glycoside hydrolase family 5 protein [candidate division KSB1 bacterium]|nr:glycoside hydrolase family 5 protein [candidate division KSB1 bacterium]MDZ7346316.1 glycoside hydrolase family 5 protein [candidate division KSB1 bacterium]